MVALISWLLFTCKKGWVGCLLQPYRLKNILWSNHISPTTLPYGIHANNLQGVKPDSLICVAAWAAINGTCLYVLQCGLLLTALVNRAMTAQLTLFRVYISGNQRIYTHAYNKVI